MVRTVLLENEVTQVSHHVVDEVELDARLASIRLVVIGILVFGDLISTVDHKAEEDVKVGIELAPRLRRSLLQHLDHLVDEADTDCFGLLPCNHLSSAIE